MFIRNISLLGLAYFLLGIGDINSGYRLNPGEELVVIAGASCQALTNLDSSKSYFIPTKSAAERTSLTNISLPKLIVSTCPSTCKEILSQGRSRGSGNYQLLMPGMSLQSVYCDMSTAGGGWTLVTYSRGVSPAVITKDIFVNPVNTAWLTDRSTAGRFASLGAEVFSKRVGSTDGMFVSSVYGGGAPYIDLAMGPWNYDVVKCTGNLRHTSRTAGCPGQNANDNYNSADYLNLTVDGGMIGIVPSYGPELCYSGLGNCNFEFYLR